MSAQGAVRGIRRTPRGRDTVPPRPAGRRLDEAGVALIAALWSLLLLASLGSGIALAARRDVWLAGSHERRAAARWAAAAGTVEAGARVEDALGAAAAARGAVASGARAGAALGAAAGDGVGPGEESVAERNALLTLNEIDSLFAWRGETRLPGGAAYRVELRDATARLNLNAAGEPELRAFLSRWIRDERALAEVSHSILDWRDPDDLSRAQGAEEAHYASLAHPVRPRNGPLLTVRELLLVRGITPELYREVEPFVVALPTDRLRVNLNTAPPEVLAAIPGFSPELAGRVVELRLASPLTSAAYLLRDPEANALFDHSRGGLASMVVAIRPEVLELRSAGWAQAADEVLGAPERSAEYLIEVLYEVGERDLSVLRRWEGAP